MAKKDKKVESLKHQLARALADYQNLQKRITRESQDIVRQANKKFILRFLPVLDVLEKAASHIEDEGLRLAVGQFKEALAQSGVSQIEVKPGDKFDAKIHEAVDVIEGKDKDKIAEVLLKGYLLEDEEVIRPAQVKVYGKAEKKEELEKELLRGDYV